MVQDVFCERRKGQDVIPAVRRADAPTKDSRHLTDVRVEGDGDLLIVDLGQQ